MNKEDALRYAIDYLKIQQTIFDNFYVGTIMTEQINKAINVLEEMKRKIVEGV
jgi:hypothetical protein